MVIIMRGVSGGGKSTFAGKLMRTNGEESDREPLFDLFREAAKNNVRGVFSADQFFLDGDGEYVFDRNRLGDAHADCMRRFVTFLHVDPITGYKRLAIVDNTNTTVEEIAPYAAVARAFGHEVHIVEIEIDPGDAFVRNVHKVPLATVDSQEARICQTRNSLKKGRYGAFHILRTGKVYASDE